MPGTHTHAATGRKQVNGNSLSAQPQDSRHAAHHCSASWPRPAPSASSRTAAVKGASGERHGHRCVQHRSSTGVRIDSHLVQQPDSRVVRCEIDRRQLSGPARVSFGPANQLRCHPGVCVCVCGGEWGSDVVEAADLLLGSQIIRQVEGFPDLLHTQCGGVQHVDIAAARPTARGGGACLLRVLALDVLCQPAAGQVDERLEVQVVRGLFLTRTR